MSAEQRKRAGDLITIIGLSDMRKAEVDAETREFYDAVRALHDKTIGVVQRGTLVEEDTRGSGIARYPHHETTPVEVSDGVHVRLVEQVSRFKDTITDEQTGDLYTYGVTVEQVFPDATNSPRQILHVQPVQVRDWNNEALKPGPQSKFVIETANGIIDIIEATHPQPKQ